MKKPQKHQHFHIRPEGSPAPEKPRKEMIEKGNKRRELEDYLERKGQKDYYDDLC